jgi:hypothetical protein
MIAEFLRAATTPCRWHLRRLGYLGEAIGLEARYRRCRAAWQPHIEACRALIADAAHSCRNHRRAVVLGSGGLNDVPLAELAATFDEVVLADIAHLPQTARLIRPYRNVRQLAFDATGLVAGLWRMPAGAALPAPTDTLSALNADFLVSPNLLVQLPVMPGRLLERQGGPAPEIAAFCRSLAQANLDGLRAATTSGAVVCLISEVEHLLCAPDGTVVERDLPLAGFEPELIGKEWIWDIAPRPEADRQHDLRYRVVGTVL